MILIHPNREVKWSAYALDCIKYIFSKIWSLLKRLHSLIKMKRLHEGELQYGEIYSVITTSRVCLRQVSITEKIISKPFQNFAICSSKSIISLFGTILYMYELFLLLSALQCNDYQSQSLWANKWRRLNIISASKMTSGYGFG